MKWQVTVMLLVTLVLGGCQNSGNPNAPVDTAAHEAGWIRTHGPVALKDLTTCQVCHGVNFTGNGPVPSCYSCHLGGPPFFIHPPSPEPSLEWRYPVNHGAIAKKNLIACQGCHGRLGGAGSNPAFDRSIGGLEKGCESTVGCHNNKDLINTFNNGHNPGTAHPSFDPNNPNKQDQMHWYGENIVYRTTAGGPATNYPIGHYNAGNMTNACALCHGANLRGPAEGGVGPACTACHVLDPIANPSRCVSCHGPLPGQTGTPLKPLELAAQVGRTDLHLIPVFQTFTSQLTARMRRDPSYVPIPSNPQNFYYQPVSTRYTSDTDLTNRSSHLHHDSLSCTERQTTDNCRTCHGDFNTTVKRHHALIPLLNFNCLACHGQTGPFDVTKDINNCQNCHIENFCP